MKTQPPFIRIVGLLIRKWKRAEEKYVEKSPGGMSSGLTRYLFRFSSGMTFHATAPLFPFFPYYGRCLIVHVSTFFLRVLRNPGLSCANIARTICAVGDADREKEAEEIRVVKPCPRIREDVANPRFRSSYSRRREKRKMKFKV